MRTLVISLCLAALLCFTTAARPARCLLPKQKGWLNSRCIHRYYFNSATGTCDGFCFSGWGGNANRFVFKYDCQQECLFGHQPVRCSLPKKKGPCRYNQQKWYFNSETKKCERFTYGGCGGNANNFYTRISCMDCLS